MTTCSHDHWQALQDKAREIMLDKEVPGVAMGLLQDSEVTSVGLGITNIEHPSPISEETLFQIGSITKTFTATIIMRLVEQGDLDLDAPIRQYLPDFKVMDKRATEEVTTRHLLTHTAGWAGDYFLNTGEGVDALEKYVAAMDELPQISPLGANFSYNNAAYYLAGHLIEHVSGMPYEGLLKEILLTPLAMEQAYLYAGDVLTHSFVVGHEKGDEGIKVARPWALPRAVHPVGGLVTNIPTLLRYAQFQMGDGSTDQGDRILAAESLKATHEPLVKIRESEYWGLGWKIWEVDDVRLISHGGGTKGQITHLTIVPERNFAFSVFTNAELGGFVTEALTRQALLDYLDIEQPKPVPTDCSPEELEPFCGRYARPFAEIELGILNKRLIGQLVYKAGFPDKDAPPPTAPPPMTFAFTGNDQLIVIDGDAKDTIVDAIRYEAGKIGWLRFGTRLYKRAGE